MLIAARGAVPADEVWDRYVRPQRWPEWSPQIRSVDYPHARLVALTSGRVYGLLGVRADFDVDAVDEAARTWSWRVRWGPVTVRLHHRVAATPDGTCTDLDLEGPVPVTAAYAPLAQYALRRLVSR